MKNLLAGLIVCALAVAHYALYPVVYADKVKLEHQTQVNYVLPASFIHIISLDFKGLAADFMFLQANFFIGEKIEKRELITLKDWAYFKRIIDEVTDLDPYFYDPYYFAGGMLAWGPHRYEDAIDILKKGMRYRTWDRRFPFIIGFYYFYFLDNPEQGAKYLAQAAKYPNAPPRYTTLASRLAYYAGDHESSVMLLQEMLSRTRDKKIRSMYQKRLLALNGAILLERAVKEYRHTFGVLPANIQRLVADGLIVKIPVDPYGGQYILTKNGRVFSTSKFSERISPQVTPK